jgi:hypothetical protein
MSTWSVTIRVTDCASAEPIFLARVESPYQSGQTDRHGQAIFTAPGNQEWYVVRVLRQSYVIRDQLVHKNDAGKTITICLLRQPEPTRIPAPTNLVAEHLGGDEVRLSWTNPRRYSRVLAGWSEPGGTHHQTEIAGSPTSVILSGPFRPGSAYDLKVKGGSRRLLGGYNYSEWTEIRWVYPPPTPEPESGGTAPPAWDLPVEVSLPGATAFARLVRERSPLEISFGPTKRADVFATPRASPASSPSPR